MELNHEDPELKLSFDPRTIEHLGFKMYSRLPNAVAELVANSYDADAVHVDVVVDTSGKQSVRVTDDGHGMSPQDLADKYLRIGRNRRTEDNGYSESGKRRVAGRKGLGKLALFGIGSKITIRTKRAGTPAWKVVTLKWEDLRRAAGGDYMPGQTSEPAADPAEHGTVITVEELKRKTQVDVSELASSLAQLFNYVDGGFNVTASNRGGRPIAITRDLRYGAIEEETRWEVPIDVPEAGVAPAVVGVVIAAKKPLRQELRGLTIYVKGRLANDPEFFGVPESSYAYSYITGYIEADYLDDQDEDVVATDRRSINWDSPKAAALREYLAAVLREVARLRRGTRRTAKEKELREDLGIDVEQWTETIEDQAAADSVRQVLEVAISPDTELSNKDRESLVLNLMAIAPEYADFHWRSLHPDVQTAATTSYKKGEYFYALLEAIKVYVKDVQAVSGVNADEFNTIQAAFAVKQPKIDVAAPYLPGKVTEQTAKNIREAQKAISEALWQGFRSPIAHEVLDQLKDHEVFSYQDCLDALSILSHLRRRIEKAAPPPQP
ncbi:TIGR02391 family protein [Nocardioides sp.]|uniref:TIGR02391 family protein n=1 Tax=Nocardioides sp. TaxID=35761 RepID=UPI001997D05B|nr:TIGR02391 family protein [Nocardioides sp.]MBC7276214.1 TIGR02391 family protein [Nocardioides sp.]